MAVVSYRLEVGRRVLAGPFLRAVQLTLTPAQLSIGLVTVTANVYFLSSSSDSRITLIRLIEGSSTPIRSFFMNLSSARHYRKMHREYYNNNRLNH